MEKTGAAIRVAGRVQGVGFRYWALQRAKQLDLTGFVKNDPDGTVFTVAEGDRGNVESYIDELKQGPGTAAVDDISVSWREFEGKYPDFQISH